MTTRRRASSRLVLIVAALLATACATAGVDPLLATGQALKAAGDEFLNAGRLYDGLYREKKISEPDYDQWRRFVPEFQKAHGTAFTTWKVAVQTKDASGAERAKAIVDELRARVLALVLGVQLPTTAPLAPPGR